MKTSFVVTVEDLVNVRNTRARRAKQFKGPERHRGHLVNFDEENNYIDIDRRKNIFEKVSAYLNSKDKIRLNKNSGLIILRSLTEQDINSSWKRVVLKRAEEVK